LIEVSAARSNDASESVREAALRASLATFAHQADGTDPCAYSGAASASPLVEQWINDVRTVGAGLPGLPGTIEGGQQIRVTNTAAGFNRVEITVCWKDPGTAAGTAMRRHTLVTFVNGV
jgi:type IV pilus assembly protein PilV